MYVYIYIFIYLYHAYIDTTLVRQWRPASMRNDRRKKNKANIETAQVGVYSREFPLAIFFLSVSLSLSLWRGNHAACIYIRFSQPLKVWGMYYICQTHHFLKLCVSIRTVCTVIWFPLSELLRDKCSRPSTICSVKKIMQKKLT